MIALYLLVILATCVIIWRASDGFEAASDYLGRNLNDGVRGATINAIGSSMPELFTTLWFLFVLHDRNGFAGGIGTTAGSAIFNAMIIPAVVIFAVIAKGLTSSVNVSRKVVLRDGLALIFAELILILLVSGDRLTWWHGLILMLTYGIYVVVMLFGMSSSTEEAGSEEEEIDDDDDEKRPSSLVHSLLTLDLESVFITKEINTANAWILLIASMLVIGGSCAGLVWACEQSAGELGIATYFVAVVLASAATSVPDTIISYRDAMKGEYDDAVANALGSNIFDVCFALGLPLFIYTMINGDIVMDTETIENITELRVFLLVSTILAFFVFLFKRGMGKIQALALLAIYVGFTAFIASKAYELQWALDLGEFLRGLVQ